MEQRLDVLTQRLDRLSRENRRYRRVAVGALILGCAALLMGQVAPPGVADEVRARRFLLVDDRGGTRAALTVAPDGTALFIVADGSRRPRVSLTVGTSGAPSLAVYDGRGHRRATLGVDGGDAPFLLLADGEERGLATLGVTADGGASLTFSDTAARRRLVAGLITGEPTVALTDAGGKGGVRLAVDGDAPRLGLADTSGDDRLWLALRRDSPVLQFFDRNRLARSGLTTINDDAGIAVMSEGGGSKPGLVLYDKDKKIVWSAP
jgi:hypothetical protein